MQQPRRIVELDSNRANPVAALMGLPTAVAPEYNQSINSKRTTVHQVSKGVDCDFSNAFNNSMSQENLSDDDMPIDDRI